MKDIYEKRAKQLDKIISSLCTTYESETDAEAKAAILHDINTLSSVENNTAKILVSITTNELKSKEIELSELVTDEKHKFDMEGIRVKDDENKLKAEDLALHKAELELKRKVSDIQALEIDLKSRELDISHEKDVADKEIAEKKLEVEKHAVLGRIAGEGLTVLGTVAGVAGTLLSLKAVMRFEKNDEGGIIPSKLMSLIFKNL